MKIEPTPFRRISLKDALRYVDKHGAYDPDGDDFLHADREWVK